jgi:hypothetical protein
MGLFGFLKSKPELPAQADDVFTQLSAAMNSDGDASARQRLWAAVFGLEQWHFVDFAVKGAKPIAPMHTTHEGRSCVLAYTSRERAEIALRHYNAVEAMSFAAASFPRDGALERICQLPRGKPEFVLFNAGTGGNGFAETVESVAAMSDFFADALPEGALHRLADMAAAVPDPTPMKRLARRLEKLAKWYFIADADHQDIPHLMMAGDRPAFAVYTSAAKVAARVAGDASLATRTTFELSSGQGVALLAACMAKTGEKVSDAVFNPGEAGFVVPIAGLTGKL